MILNLLVCTKFPNTFLLSVFAVEFSRAWYEGWDAENPWIFDVLRQISVDVHCLLDERGMFIQPVQ